MTLSFAQGTERIALSLHLTLSGLRSLPRFNSCGLSFATYPW
jgi:hypothetical protein